MERYWGGGGGLGYKETCRGRYPGRKAGKPLLLENLKTRVGPWGGMKASAVLRSENDLLEMTKQLM